MPNVARYLPGRGRFSRIVVQDFTLRDKGIIRRMPVRGADTLMADHIRDYVGADVTVEVVPEIPSPWGMGYPTGPGATDDPQPEPAGTVHIALVHLLQGGGGGRTPGSLPVLAVWGDAADLGAHYLLLDQPAPGDVPCRPFCATAAQGFAGVRGRLNLLLRNVSRER